MHSSTPGSVLSHPQSIFLFFSLDNLFFICAQVHWFCYLSSPLHYWAHPVVRRERQDKWLYFTILPLPFHSFLITSIFFHFHLFQKKIIITCSSIFMMASLIPCKIIPIINLFSICADCLFIQVVIFLGSWFSMVSWTTGYYGTVNPIQSPHFSAFPPMEVEQKAGWVCMDTISAKVVHSHVTLLHSGRMAVQLVLQPCRHLPSQSRAPTTSPCWPWEGL